ncbi:polysaccharide deacetylase family protein [Actinokineospora sp. NBRC 105648]|uniref:polysaccharide deacetylase family protein n=1 Tax=Actinokineospora sp. NBRC 105648 TaxID=3032206 RepID=UPI0024A3111D|nr:polysaccharide deacetylase family protein [Actinokineospora sp. NBRC 105648]GLZ40425.1 chitooligosaccharide deacetylase [Actinokineospora sp. NBRC 105648]
MSTPAPSGSPAAAPEPYPFGTGQAEAPATVGGLAPVVRKIETDKRYVFLTIDDGEVRDPAAPDLIATSGARPTLFLNERYFRPAPEYFRDIQERGHSVIGDHTVNHPNLRGKPYALQHKEICDDAAAEAADFGQRPTLFRPPYGNYDDTTRRAAADCGMAALVLWTAAVNDGVVQFQAGDHLRPGDIVLMHFRKTFTADYQAFLHRATQDGLTPVPLSDFLTPRH